MRTARNPRAGFVAWVSFPVILLAECVGSAYSFDSRVTIRHPIVKRFRAGGNRWIVEAPGSLTCESTQSEMRAVPAHVRLREQRIAASFPRWTLSRECRIIRRDKGVAARQTLQSGEA
jgi:hypothetical protein